MRCPHKYKRRVLIKAVPMYHGRATRLKEAGIEVAEGNHRLFLENTRKVLLKLSRRKHRLAFRLPDGRAMNEPFEYAFVLVEDSDLGYAFGILTNSGVMVDAEGPLLSLQGKKVSLSFKSLSYLNMFQEMAGEAYFRSWEMIQSDTEKVLKYV